MTDLLLESLRQLTGRPTAAFRDGQRQAVLALVDDRQRVLVVQRTGWGKSAVYFLATHLMRQRGAGPTLLISPLLALMRNQIDAATRLGLDCMTINSASETTVAELSNALRANTVDLILVSPERLANPQFAEQVLPAIGASPGLIVIDEVHCISDWGHDFRPDYRRIGQLLDSIGDGDVPILGCTATANDRVVADVAEQLGAQLTVFRGPLRRDGLALRALPLDRQAERLAWLVSEIPSFEGAGIVYCLTVRDVEHVASWLTQQGIKADAYHGGIDNDRRLAAEAKLLHNEIKVLVATTALGMGYDKPDLGFVIHFQMPGSPVAYYQQVGRAGRALDTSVGVLLRGVEDEAIQNYFIDTAFVDERLSREVLAAFESDGAPVSLVQAQVDLNVGWGRLESITKQLDLDGALRRVTGQSFARTDKIYIYPAKRIASVTAARRAEQQAMLDYFTTTDCRMAYLSGLLDDGNQDRCGVCDNCGGPSAAVELPVELVAAAEAFLRSRPVTIRPKKMRVRHDTGGRARIPVGELVAEGRALAMLNDGGWGRMIRQSIAAGRIDDRLIAAAATTIRQWGIKPTAVAAVPTARASPIVIDAATRLAAALGLELIPVLKRVEQRRPQSEQHNMAHQQANVEGAFAVTGQIPAGEILLVDDITQSGWTLTEVGRLLRRHGAATVYPFAFAVAG